MNKFLGSLLYLFITLSLVDVVLAYRISYEGLEDVSFGNINAEHNLDEQGNLNSKLTSSFLILPNYKYDNFSLYFNPWEHIDNAPITNFTYVLCEYLNNTCNVLEPQLLLTTKERSFIHDGISEIKNYSNYALIINVSRGNWHFYRITMNYTTPNAIFKQGDYYVASLTFPNMEDKNLTNILMLPNKDYIPRFMPEAKETARFTYQKDNAIYSRWGFIFEGAKPINIWYFNDEELKKAQENLQDRYTWKGIKWGFFAALILLILEKLFFHWSPFGNRIMVRILRKMKYAYLICNVKNKRYHTIDCEFLDNIDDKNKQVFKNYEDAEKANFKPCKFCNMKK